MCPGVGHDDQPGAGHLCGKAAVAWRRGAIRRTHHDHGRYPDLGQARVAVLARERPQDREQWLVILLDEHLAEYRDDRR
jgi:hypothetical protein